MWTILERFGYKQIFRDLNRNLNRPENTFVLGGHLHRSVDEYDVWFVPVEGPEVWYITHYSAC